MQQVAGGEEGVCVGVYIYVSIHQIIDNLKNRSIRYDTILIDTYRIEIRYDTLKKRIDAYRYVRYDTYR